MPHRRTFSHGAIHKNASSYRHSYSSKKELIMTDGPVFFKILAFVLPLMVTNLLQVLYNAADIMVVSLSSEPDAVGAIGVTSSFVNLIVNIFIGFATGANIVIARLLGAKDNERVSRATHTAIAISTIFGVSCGILGIFVSRPILSLMGTEGKLLDLATRYTVIYFIGAPFISATNYLIAIFRAKGDTKTPLFILSTSGLLNFLLNLFFVLVMGMSVEGVAIATAIANIFSFIWLGIKLSQDDSACRFSFKKLCFDKKAFTDILYIGIPAAIQGALFSIANMMIQSSIIKVNNLTATSDAAFSPVIRGNTAAANLDSFMYTAQNSVYQAAITFTSQNIGASKPRRVYRIMGSCYAWGIIISVIASAIIFLAKDPLLSLYKVTDGAVGTLEHIAYQAATTRLLCLNVLYFVPFMEVGCGVLRGLGRSITSTVVSLIGICGFRILWILTVFTPVLTSIGASEPMKALVSVYVSFPLSHILSGIIFLIISLKTLKSLIKAKPALT